MTDAHPYRLVLTPTARRHLAESLPAPVSFAACEFVNGPLLENPLRVGKRLGPPLQDRYTARRGTYRVIYRIDEDDATVTVVAIAARSDAYRTR